MTPVKRASRKKSQSKRQARKKTASRPTRTAAKKARKRSTVRPAKAKAVKGRSAKRTGAVSKSRVVTGRVLTASPKRLSTIPETAKSRISKLRAMLESKRAEILQQIKRAREDSVETDRISFPEVGDLVSASLEKEKAFEYGEIGINALREIDTALEKLKEGTYGICEKCGKAIAVKRLEVVPSARLCIRCQVGKESSVKPRPAPDSR